MQGIPLDLIEAAKIDGARDYQIIRRVTLPLIKGTILALIIGATAAFSFSHWLFRGKEQLFLVSLIGRMFPPVTTLIPIYFMMKLLRILILDTHISLILVYAAFQVPLVLLILRDFFSQVPREICECAYLDGCKSWQVFVRIVLPLTKHGIIAAGILCFVEAWNEFLFALVLTSFKAKTAPVILATYVENEGMLQWGALEKLGFSYEEFSKLNPGLIYCSCSGYGPTGPYKNKPGQDLLAQSMSGLASTTGRTNGPPIATGTYVADAYGAMLAALGIVTALYARNKTGQGQKVDVCLLDAAIHMQCQELSLFLNGGYFGPRENKEIAHPLEPPP